MGFLSEDRLFPTEPTARSLARALYAQVKDAPIISPHGHTDPQWFAKNEPFEDVAKLFITPDHYVFRMLHSQGVALEDLGVPRADGGAVETDPRKIWRLFARHYRLFAATPSRMWIDHALQDLCGLDQRLSPETADAAFDAINEKLASPAFRPRALFERFNLDVLATTESALDDLAHHRTIRDSGWQGRVITTYRPDAVIDPDFDGFIGNVEAFCAHGGGAVTWESYLAAHHARRAYFASLGATATDHGHPTANTANLSRAEAAALFDDVMTGKADLATRELFRAQMLTEMARMSVADGLVMQIHAGSQRNHSDWVLARFGRDKGYDIPQRTDYVNALRPLLQEFGRADGFHLILFTLDESSYARELAPLAGVYPCLFLGPPWWFHDSYEGMMRFRRSVTETAGFYNLAGFNDDTRAFCSIPARHDVARRVDAAYLAELIVTGRLDESEAGDLMQDLTTGLARRAYKL
ncbi:MULTISPECIES: glucuronate isomerase [unclassified Roseobacter]|uniref:glucuronate isomerase n=1 Tax=unclassified Roseobacter TaxID=196798 RepID=UPI0030EDBD25